MIELPVHVGLALEEDDETDDETDETMLDDGLHLEPMAAPTQVRPTVKMREAFIVVECFAEVLSVSIFLWYIRIY